MALADELRRSPLLAHLPDAALARIAATASRRRLGRGEFVFRQGDPAERFFLIEKGKLKLRVASESGKEQVLHFFGAGDSFGEGAVLGRGAYPADAVVLAEASLVQVPAAPFLASLRGDPDFALQVMRSLAKRLAEFAHIIENLSTREVKARLACYLLRQGEPAAGGEVLLPVGKGELARLLGTTAESLSRALRSLADAGAIRVDGKRIALVDPAALGDLAAD